MSLIDTDSNTLVEREGSPSQNPLGLPSHATTDAQQNDVSAASSLTSRTTLMGGSATSSILLQTTPANKPSTTTDDHLVVITDVEGNSNSDVEVESVGCSESNDCGSRSGSVTPSSKSLSWKAAKEQREKLRCKAPNNGRVSFSAGSDVKIARIGSMSSNLSSTRLVDLDRDPACHRAKIVYSADMDRDSLTCCYRWYCVCGDERRKKAASRTFIEVHDNGIYSNAPSGCCCCAFTDNATFMHFDDPRAGEVQQATCCSPFPYVCAHAGGCSGDAVAMAPSEGCCGRPSNFGHCGMGCLMMLCPTNFFYGLAEGEASKLTRQIESARHRFNSKGHGQMM